MGSEITLKGKTYTITLPPFAEREDVAVSYSAEAKHPRRQQRALFGALGLCVPEFGGVELYESMGFDLVRYGGRVYSQAMADGHKREELISGSVECFTAICESLFPREEAVSKAANFTNPAEERQTA